MNKSTIKIYTSVIALFFAFTITSNAQLTAGSIGIGSLFAGSSNTAWLHYALMEDFDAAAGISFIKKSYSYEGASEPDGGTTLGLNLMGRYFLMNGRDVSPYIGGVLGFTSMPGSSQDISSSLFNIGVIFGGQVFLAKGFAVYAHLGLGYETITETTKVDSPGTDISKTESTISFNNSGIGAVFYFGQ